VKVTYEEPRKV